MDKRIRECFKDTKECKSKGKVQKILNNKELYL